ncbi:hypothetical protein AVEN_213815-1 [Araneus ventricosus]|uniref:Uncharacterized protein n=1 Tax=Araneus ventricosus TaxID=182803 RepID=A0A4Y2Q239_ARAVE|nr:hypothetical protein AVEN_148809-1 [Araneus ventricosus]GBN57579.1 hypothetical protein AVEN_213815-1 [Araneus ventricosus]
MSSKRENSPYFEDDGNDHRFVSLDENLPNDVIGYLLRCTCLRDTPFNRLHLLHRRCLPPHRRCVLPPHRRCVFSQATCHRRTGVAFHRLQDAFCPIAHSRRYRESSQKRSTSDLQNGRFMGVGRRNRNLWYKLMMEQQ